METDNIIFFFKLNKDSVDHHSFYKWLRYDKLYQSNLGKCYAISPTSKKQFYLALVNGFQSLPRSKRAPSQRWFQTRLIICNVNLPNCRIVLNLSSVFNLLLNLGSTLILLTSWCQGLTNTIKNSPNYITTMTRHHTQFTPTLGLPMKKRFIKSLTNNQANVKVLT